MNHVPVMMRPEGDPPVEIILDLTDVSTASPSYWDDGCTWVVLKGGQTLTLDLPYHDFRTIFFWNLYDTIVADA